MEHTPRWFALGAALALFGLFGALLRPPHPGALDREGAVRGIDMDMERAEVVVSDILGRRPEDVAINPPPWPGRAWPATAADRERMSPERRAALRRVGGYESLARGQVETLLAAYEAGDARTRNAIHVKLLGCGPCPAEVTEWLRASMRRVDASVAGADLMRCILIAKDLYPDTTELYVWWFHNARDVRVRAYAAQSMGAHRAGPAERDILLAAWPSEHDPLVERAMIHARQTWRGDAAVDRVLAEAARRKNGVADRRRPRPRR